MPYFCFTCILQAHHLLAVLSFLNEHAMRLVLVADIIYKYIYIHYIMVASLLSREYESALNQTIYNVLNTMHWKCYIHIYICIRVSRSVFTGCGNVLPISN